MYRQLCTVATWAWLPVGNLAVRYGAGCVQVLMWRMHAWRLWSCRRGCRWPRRCRTPSSCWTRSAAASGSRCGACLGTLHPLLNRQLHGAGILSRKTSCATAPGLGCIADSGALHPPSHSSGLHIWVVSGGQRTSGRQRFLALHSGCCRDSYCLMRGSEQDLPTGKARTGGRLDCSTRKQP